VRLIAEMGYISLNKQFIDGTKIESASNKYTFVWRGSVEKYKEKLQEKIKSVLSDIESAIKEDTSENNPELEEINCEELEAKIEQLNQNIDKLNKKQQKNLHQLQNEHLPRLQKYENQLDTLGSRNSFSKTDTDATFMRMKDDHMKNGQLKPAYNTQISTENQFVTNFSVHQRPGDTATLIAHLEQFNDFFGKQSEQVVADAGYGSEENYEYMHNNGIEAFVKYNYFHKELKRKFKNDIFHPSNLFYNAEKDYFVCPMGQHMENMGTGTRRSDLGYVSHVTYYQAKKCEGCPLRWGCHKSKKARIIEINHRLIEYKRLARERLLSEQGVKLRGQRCIEPEAVFGQLKSNNMFNRFKLRGLEKVIIEFGLAVISHNLRKLASICSDKIGKIVFEQLFVVLVQICVLFKFNKKKKEKFKRKSIKFWKDDAPKFSSTKMAA
jgi:gas vesicle protein